MRKPFQTEIALSPAAPCNDDPGPPLLFSGGIVMSQRRTLDDKMSGETSHAASLQHGVSFSKVMMACPYGHAGERKELPFELLHFFSQFRDSFEKISDKAIIGDVEDWGFGIFIDRHNHFGIFHSS